MLKTLPSILLGLVLLFMAAGIAYRAEFRLIDDHLLVASLDSEHPGFPPIMIRAAKRFGPLAGQEYTALGYTTPITASLCYGFNAAQLVAFVGVLWWWLRPRLSRPFAALAILSLILSTGFVAAWFRLYAGERGAAFFLLAGLLCLERAEGRWKWPLLLGAIVSVNLSLYYKEPMFILVGTYAFLRLIAQWQCPGEAGGKGAMALLLVSAAIFVVAFIAYVRVPSGPSYIADRQFQPPFQSAIFAIKEYAFGGYPLVFFLAIPWAAMRVWRAVSSKSVAPVVEEPELFAGLSYIGAILVLNLPGTTYYLLPGYVMCVRPVWALLARSLHSLRSGWIWPVAAAIAFAGLGISLMVVTRAINESALRLALVLGVGAALGVFIYSRKPVAMRALAVALSLFVLVGNAVPAAFNLMSRFRHDTAAYQATVRRMAAELEQSPGSARRIFIINSPRAYCVELYDSLGTYLRRELKREGAFDLFSEVPPEDRFRAQPAAKWSVFRSAEAVRPRSGDLLLTNPDTREPGIPGSVLLYASPPTRGATVPSVEAFVGWVKLRVKRAQADPLVADPYRIFSVS